MRTFTMLAAASAAALALVATACGSDGESHAETAPAQATTERATQVGATTTEAGPEPITAAEKRWLGQVERYSEHLERDAERIGTITHLRMRRSAKLYAGCASMLRRAGDPGRFAPAQRIAQRGCNRLDKAAHLLAQAIAASDPGGSVVAGTPEEKQFDRAMSGAFEAAGNAPYDLQRALERAHEIERSMES